MRKSCLMNKIEEFFAQDKVSAFVEMPDKLKCSNLPMGFLMDVQDSYLIDFVGVPTISALLIIYSNIKSTPWCAYVLNLLFHNAISIFF